MDGILVINKEKGHTSHDIVYGVKKILNEKVGHTGTLDPMATRCPSLAYTEKELRYQNI